MSKVGCMLQAYHNLAASLYDNEPLDSPEAIERLKKSSDGTDNARIATIYISEEQALKIVRRLWPNKGLLGATCGQRYSIENAEQTLVVNEVLAHHSIIDFNPEKHQWMLQTWPE
jgi:hypothetical protein